MKWVSPHRWAVGVLLVVISVGFTGCSKQPEDSLGKAYVAPASLNLRRQLTQRNATVAVLKHGDLVTIVDVRRRFVKVRTARGAEGWVDSLDLLTPEQMDQIKRERREALALPSEGNATPFEALNIHLQASRRSPAFMQIAEGTSVAVLAHRIEPKITAEPRPPLFVVQKPPPQNRRPRKNQQSRSSSRLPPMPPPPKPPENWQELSGQPATEEHTAAAEKAEREKAAAVKAHEPQKPVVLEAWSLVRTKDNQVGWVLSRNLSMSIPDEVAQYAEGKRITSYFDLGSVQDQEKGLEHNWLWTTASSLENFDFDSWRVFLWNRRRHRFETSYRQRDLEGYFPVHVDAPDPNGLGRTFELITKDDDGKFRRRTYLFDGTRVHLTGTENYQPGTVQGQAAPTGIQTEKLASPSSRGSWLRNRWRSLTRRFSSSSR